jgi:SAM-dependent methyltransferase
MLSALSDSGWRVVGNERTISAATFARQDRNLPVFVGELDALTATPFADLIIMFQVLEHLPDPISSLTSLHQRLKPHGKLIIGVPNINSWQAAFGGPVWFHLDVPRHLFHYSVPSLEYCLNKTGFKILHVNFQSLEHDPFGWIQTLLNRVTHSHNNFTKILMALEKPSISLFPILALTMLAGIISLPLTVASWLFKRGAIMEVVAEKINH